LDEQAAYGNSLVVPEYHVWTADVRGGAVPVDPWMVGVVVAVGVTLGGWVLSVAAARRRRRVRSAALEAAWGSGSVAPTPVQEARRLFELMEGGPPPGAYRLDRQTWSDLDMDEVFGEMDHTVSCPGSQVLYAMLREPLLEERRLEERRAVIEGFQEDPELRTGVGLALWPLGHRGATRLAGLLWGPLPELRSLEGSAPLLALTAVGITAGCLLGVLPVPLLLGVFAVNTVVHFLHKRRTDHQPLGELARLASVVVALSGPDLRRLGPAGARIRDGAQVAGVVRRRLAPLLVDDGLGLTQYLKIFFLVDVLSYRAVHGVLTRHNELLRGLFLAAGEVDALRAMASYLGGRRVSCAPDHGAPRPGWSVRGMVHPLLETPVPNDFTMGAGAVLITGSNMSGKTTFLKTLGVNAVLAQVCHRALAAGYALPFLRVITSIGRADNLIEGRSYYLAEVESVHRIVSAAESREPHLLLLDEIFRGTNTAERIAGGYGVLRHLANGRHLVFVATHDGELVDLLDGVYEVCHFTEEVGAEGLSFDYTLRPGPSTRSNAIALLEFAGFPAGIVRDARRTLEARSGV